MLLGALVYDGQIPVLIVAGQTFFACVLRRLGGKDLFFPLLLYVWDGAGGQKV